MQNLGLEHMTKYKSENLPLERIGSVKQQNFKSLRTEERPSFVTGRIRATSLLQVINLRRAC